MEKGGKILVTGGAGFIGAHLLQAFAQWPLLVADVKSPDTQEPNQEFIKGDVRNIADMRSAFLRGPVSCIIHLAAAHKDFGIDQEEYFSVNEGGTEVICKLASEFGVKKIVFFSSVAVYGERNEPTNDQTVPNPTNDYGASKLAAEKLVIDWQRQNSNRTAIILRPALVYGEGNEANMFRLIDQINKGMYFNVGKGDNIKSIAYVKNLVDAAYYLFDRLPVGLHIYNYADEPHLKTSELGLTIAAELGKPKPKSFPLIVLLLLAKPFDIISKFTGRDLPISTARVRKYASRTHHRAQDLFAQGFKPKFTTQEGLSRMVAWYKRKNQA
ncbi:MAG TPA: NAD(P)-dependent oxidoreductase [Phnomibacter sp.]|nr:NAD(P)-dependent oxidoreductase [Phnomibacter sp.]